MPITRRHIGIVSTVAALFIAAGHISHAAPAPNVSVSEALEPPSDPSFGKSHRGVNLEPRRTFKFINTDGKEVKISFDNNFPGGRLGRVLPTGPNHYTIVSLPENEPPINESQWYAFRIHSPQEKQTITVELAYGVGMHRYLPKISYDGIHWVSLDPKQLKTNQFTASFPLTLDGRTVWVAAQELVTSGPIEDWAKSIVKTHPYITLSSIGKSHGGRTIPMLTINQGKTKKPTVVLIGRQHPPEVTGTLAQMQFVETLCDGSALSKAFLEKFNVIVIPNVNPDGVDQGHWRHNGVGPCRDTHNDGICKSGKGGIDLNRDWAAFNEPETRAVKKAIVAHSKNGIAFFIDFHSTFKDVIYAIQYNDTASGNDALDPRVADWLKRLGAAQKDYHFTLNSFKRSNPVVPRTAMGWVDLQFKAPVMTYEVGDSTPRDYLKDIATSAAQVLMQSLTQ